MLDFRFAAFLIILALGLYVRIDDFEEWLAKPQLSFFDGKPLPCETDSYYYVRLARDLIEGTYASLDALRHGTPPVLRPQPAPLLSALTALIVRHAGWELDWVAAFLPAFLGLLLAFPLYGFGRHFCGTIAGFVAALMGLLAPFYVYRSDMGWFDTDCMNVTWSMTIAFCFLKFGTCRTYIRYAWLAAGGAAAALFFWWWDQSPEAVFGIAVIPFAAAVLLLFRSKRRGDLIAVIACTILLAAVCLWQKDSIARIADSIILKGPQRYTQIAKIAGQAFPAQAVSTSEQERSSFQDAVEATTRSRLFFILGALGFCWIVCCRFREALVLSALMALSVCSFLFAERFLIFLSPLIALGLGAAVAAIWSGKERISTMLESVLRRCTGLVGARKETGLQQCSMAVSMRSFPAAAACAVLIAVMAWQPCQCLTTGITSFQKIDGKRVAGMAEAQRLTPADAVIWAWWDNGHALNYWARRRTVIDAARHGRQYSVFNAVPLAASDERFAANFMRFYVAHGVEGVSLVEQAVGGQAEGFQFLKKVLALGPDQAGSFIGVAHLQPVKSLSDTRSWLAFLFPAGGHPVYVYLDNLCLVTAHWWYWYGTWDPARQDGVHPYYETFFNVIFSEDDRDQVIHGSKGLKVFPPAGVAVSSQGTLSLSYLLVRTETETLRKRYNHPGGYGFEIAAPVKMGVMLSPDIAESMFNRLFVRNDTGLRYFLPVSLKTPYYQLWEVHGDIYEGR